METCQVGEHVYSLEHTYVELYIVVSKIIERAWDKSQRRDSGMGTTITFKDLTEFEMRAIRIAIGANYYTVEKFNLEELMYRDTRSMDMAEFIGIMLKLTGAKFSEFEEVEMRSVTGVILVDTMFSSMGTAIEPTCAYAPEENLIRMREDTLIARRVGLMLCGDRNLVMSQTLFSLLKVVVRLFKSFYQIQRPKRRTMRGTVGDYKEEAISANSVYKYLVEYGWLEPIMKIASPSPDLLGPNELNTLFREWMKQTYMCMYMLNIPSSVMPNGTPMDAVGLIASLKDAVDRNWYGYRARFEEVLDRSDYIKEFIRQRGTGGFCPGEAFTFTALGSPSPVKGPYRSYYENTTEGIAHLRRAPVKVHELSYKDVDPDNQEYQLHPGPMKRPQSPVEKGFDGEIGTHDHKRIKALEEEVREKVTVSRLRTARERQEALDEKDRLRDQDMPDYEVVTEGGYLDESAEVNTIEPTKEDLREVIKRLQAGETDDSDDYDDEIDSLSEEEGDYVIA